MTRNQTAKVSFRSKRGSCGAIKVYTSVRIPGRMHPQQIHLGYLSSAADISPKDCQQIERRLQQKWYELFGRRNVTIDRKDAAEKWGKRHHPSRPSVDREAAVRQILQWMQFSDERLTAPFGKHVWQATAAPGDGRPVTQAEFIDAYLIKLPEKVLAILSDSSLEIDINEWWATTEGPRLLWAYFRHAQRSKRAFNRSGFLLYLFHNVKRYAVANFLRSRGATARTITLGDRARDL